MKNFQTDEVNLNERKTHPTQEKKETEITKILLENLKPPRKNKKKRQGKKQKSRRKKKKDFQVKQKVSLQKPILKSSRNT